jgi:hypothetical protein
MYAPAPVNRCIGLCGQSPIENPFECGSSSYRLSKALRTAKYITELEKTPALKWKMERR